MPTSLPDKNDNAKPKFLEQVRAILRTRHYSLRTEEAYLGWETASDLWPSPARSLAFGPW